MQKKLFIKYGPKIGPLKEMMKKKKYKIPAGLVIRLQPGRTFTTNDKVTVINESERKLRIHIVPTQKGSECDISEKDKKEDD